MKIKVGRLSSGDTDRAICCCIREDRSIGDHRGNFWLPRNFIDIIPDGVDAVVLVPLWLAKRAKIDHLEIKNDNADPKPSPDPEQF